MNVKMVTGLKLKEINNMPKCTIECNYVHVEEFNEKTLKALSDMTHNGEITYHGSIGCIVISGEEIQVGDYVVSLPNCEIDVCGGEYFVDKYQCIEDEDDTINEPDTPKKVWYKGELWDVLDEVKSKVSGTVTHHLRNKDGIEKYANRDLCTLLPDDAEMIEGKLVRRVEFTSCIYCALVTNKPCPSKNQCQGCMFEEIKIDGVNV